ncbi:hypothetical protein EXIGLDRAFT_845835 [Exidia glandulosa HHB12029]|uniref:Uncharacterized protein n=1 Tax=Exidia glandulosa HHB12029 TaxID=1314781 RepID=A0A165B9K5_EXIGL|nr:hypothetical protein EXIGLDRAFT_845835 [Exidia glandulosa HHB12029]
MFRTHAEFTHRILHTTGTLSRASHRIDPIPSNPPMSLPRSPVDAAIDDELEMYSASSPQFESQDLPALRRIKPLPKRRRTSTDQATPELAQTAASPDANGGQPGIFGGEEASDIFKNTPAGRAFLSTLDNYYAAAAATSGTLDDDDQGEGDYIDHLQQPNNTKKRKVPTAPHQAHNNGENLPDDDQSGDRPATTKLDADDGEPAAVAAAAAGGRRKARVSAATIAGLQHKDMLKTRKRQLASVLGAITNGDELALDQALVAHYPNIPGATFSIPQPVEYIPVRVKRQRRRKLLLSSEPVAQAIAMAEGDFTFEAPSSSSERLVAVRTEVVDLYARFEAELARQAAKAAEAAKQSALALAESPKRAVQRARGSAASQAAEQAAAGAKGRQSKKKKRSALANASNPHHLRNYVPSRLPHSGQPPSQTTQALNAANYLGPPPIRFLSAEVPPKRRKKATSPPPAGSLGAQLTNPADEWICPFCEYNLFYGDDAAYRRAVKSRKKILQRRRRARERAAAAASGVAPVAPAPAADKPATGETHVAEETTTAGDAPAVKNLAKRDRDKGGSGPAVPV